jgi:hypothetical protein
MNRSMSLVLALFLGGCGALSASTSSGTTQTALTVPVSEAPPADKEETDKPASPGYGYIWANGYWDYVSGTYMWKAGRWVQAKQDFEYQRARYEHDSTGWVFHRPHWVKRPAGSGVASKPKS